MKPEVKKHYTPRTPDLATWHDDADREDFKYLAIIGYIIEGADRLAKEVDTQRERLIEKLEEAQKSLEEYQTKHKKAPNGDKAYFRSRIKTLSNTIRSNQKKLQEFEPEIKRSMRHQLSIAKACEQFAEDMPEALKVKSSTVRQDFYVSKNRTCERDYYAHQSLDQVVHTTHSN